MREADFAGPRLRTAADDGARGRGVMWRAERPACRSRAALKPRVLTEAMDATSSASSPSSAGSRPGSRCASMLLPVPGGPTSRMLCPPAAATSSARLRRRLAANIGEIGRGAFAEAQGDPRRRRIGTPTACRDARREQCADA